MASETTLQTTQDRFFDGGLVLRQPAKGHRIGTDAVLLAAACPALPHGRIADLGCGVGAVGLRAAQVHAGCDVVLLDNDPDILALGQENIRQNGLAGRCAVRQFDVFAPHALKGAADLVETFDIVLSNPPFADTGSGRASPNEKRARAHVMAGGLDQWISVASRLLKPKGELVVIHRADATAKLLAALGARFGGVQVMFIHPRADSEAHRVMIRARRGSKAPLAVRPPLALHAASGAFTPEADALHRGVPSDFWSQQTR